MRPTLMKYNPAFLSQEELIHSFVVRQVDLDLVVETIKENTGSSNQHVLIIGPRGMGKTMLVLRAMAHVVRDEELNSLWYPVIFSEESYEISTAAEFWLRAIFHLGRQTKSENFLQLYEQLKGERDERRLYERTLACLMDFADRQNKRLLLVVENVNMLMEEQIGSDETWDIRHTLLNEPRIMLLGTAPSRFDEIDNSGKAMFDLFKIHQLEPLDTEESKTLWENLTGRKVEETKIRPLQILTGGNPRLLAIISSFAAGASFRELMNQLTLLIDEYTTYFKSNIESLPSLERKVFVTLANIWEPVVAAGVARDARIDVNKTSSLLKRLESRGSVSIVKSSGRKKRYQVTERLYNIYHLMRISGSQSDRVRAVVDFMVNFYESEELVKKLSDLTVEACCLEPGERQDHVEAYKAIIQSVQEPDKLRRFFYSTEAEFLKLPEVADSLSRLINQFLPAERPDKGDSEEEFLKKTPLEIPEDLSTCEKNGLIKQEIPQEPAETEKAYRKAVEMNPDDETAWAQLGSFYHEKLERYEEAESAYLKAVETNPQYEWAWGQLGLLYHRALKKYEEAEMAYRKAIEINPKYYKYYGVLGMLLHWNLKRYEDAEAVYRKAIEIEPKDEVVWSNLGFLYHEKLERYEEAEKAYREAVEINPENEWVWSQLGRLYHEKMERYEEAEAAYRNATEIDLEYEWAWVKLARLYHEKMERYEEAESAYRKAIEINSEDAWVWLLLGRLYHEKMERYEEAESAYRKAIEINPEDAWIWSQLGRLYHEKMGRYEGAEAAYRKATEIDLEYDWAWVELGGLYHEKMMRYEEAESAYRKAIEINPKDDWVWSQLGRLYHEKLERYEEAGAAYQKAIEINPNDDWAWVQLGLLFHAKFGRYEEAEAAYRKAIEIDSKNVAVWAFLGFLLHNRVNKYNEAEEAYRKLIEINPKFDWGWRQLIKLQIEQSISIDHILDTISQCLKIFERSAEILNSVAWLIFETDFKAGFSKAEELAREAVEKESDLAIYQHTYASILGVQGKWEKALSVAIYFLKDPETAKKFPNDIISFFIDAAAAGFAAEGLKTLKNSPCAPYMEPLIVALQMFNGEEYNAPQEVVEVAKDVLKKIKERKKEKR